MRGEWLPFKGRHRRQDSVAKLQVSQSGIDCFMQLLIHLRSTTIEIKPIKRTCICLLFLLSTTIHVNAQLEDTSGIPPLLYIHFNKGSVVLNTPAKATLDSVVSIFKNHSELNIGISGYSGCENPSCAQRSWDRINNVYKYLMKKGIDSNRLLFTYGENDDPQIVFLSIQVETGPVSVPAPHPVRKPHH